MPDLICGCEQGGDCTRTSVCQIGAALEDQQQKMEDLQAVVDAAVEYVDMVRETHHIPVSAEIKIKVRARLYNAVMQYQENQQ